jgi:hypothetical protein
MCVADRVMKGDFAADYNPMNNLRREPTGQDGTGAATIVRHAREVNPLVYQAVTRRERFMPTKDEEQNLRL